MKHFSMSQRKEDAPPAAPRKKAKSKPKSETPFDLWLQRGLHQLYDDVASEPIPDALLRLIEDDRKK
jgi:hypothetical protein